MPSKQGMMYAAMGDPAFPFLAAGALASKALARVKPAGRKMPLPGGRVSVPSTALVLRRAMKGGGAPGALAEASRILGTPIMTPAMDIVMAPARIGAEIGTAIVERFGPGRGQVRRITPPAIRRAPAPIAGMRRRRRMRVTNPRALRRAIRRVSGFARLAQKTMSFVRGRAVGRPKFRRVAKRRT